MRSSVRVRSQSLQRTRHAFTHCSHGALLVLLLHAYYPPSLSRATARMYTFGSLASISRA